MGCVLSRWRLRGPDSGQEALPGFRSGWLVLRVDPVLAEQDAEPLDLVGELLDPFGQIRQRRVPGGPLDVVGELLDPLGQNRQRRVPGGPLLLPRGRTRSAGLV
jgi:hypothetical protein